MNCQVRDQARGPTENSVERKNRPSRGKAEYRWRNPEHRFENAERGTAAAAPLVEIAEQDGRHARQVEERVEKRAGLIHPGKTKQPQVSRDDAELPFAEVEFGDDRAPRLEPRQPPAGPAIGFWLSAHQKSVAVPAMAIWNVRLDEKLHPRFSTNDRRIEKAAACSKTMVHLLKRDDVGAICPITAMMRSGRTIPSAPRHL